MIIKTIIFFDKFNNYIYESYDTHPKHRSFYDITKLDMKVSTIIHQKVFPFVQFFGS